MEETLALIERIHEGDKEARERFVEENMGLVYTVVRRFLGRGCDREDLVQIGCIGLLKAIDKFDTSFEVRFSTYAVPMIAGEIKRFLRDDGMIKVSRLLKETGISPEELVLAMEATSGVESLSQTVYSGDGTPVLLGDRLPDRQDRNEELLNRMLLEQLLEFLTDEEQEMIRLRYFDDQTQVQVALRLGMTQVQVSRAEKRILKKLRGAAEH